jgi:hypothetical protein
MHQGNEKKWLLGVGVEERIEGEGWGTHLILRLPMEKDMVRTLNRFASQLSFNPSVQIDLQTKKHKIQFNRNDLHNNTRHLVCNMKM